MFPKELGVHFALQVVNQYATTGLIEAGALAERVLGKYNFAQIWVADNPEYRQTYVVMAALALKLPKVRLGAGVTTPYLRSAIDLASVFGTLTELTEADEISAGIGGGSAILSGMFAKTSRIDFVVETMTFLKRAFMDELIDMRDFPLICRVNNINANSRVRLRFKPKVPIRIYFGSSTYHVVFPRKLMPLVDGLIVPHNNLLALGSERFSRLIEEAEEIRRKAGASKPIKKILHLTSSISSDSRRAKDLSKRHVSHLVAAIPDEKLREFGIDVGRVNQVRAVFKEGLGIDEAVKLTTDDMVALFHISGSPAECIERIGAVFKMASQNGFDQVNIAVPVGPDLAQAITLWGTEILPSLGAN